MEYVRSTARAMHEDHMAALSLLDRIEAFLNQHRDPEPPDTAQSEARGLLSQVKAAVETEIGVHFAFEEEALFPILREAGADDMCSILQSDHDVLLPLGMRLAELAGEAGGSGFSTESWSEFRSAAGQFVDGLRGHIAKEEMGFVPALEDVLDQDQDAELIARYRF